MVEWQEDIQEEEYLGVLEIPKIHFKRGYFDFANENNTVEKNIQLINTTTPDIENGNIIFAAHSGTGYKAFFKNLDKLSLKDEIYLYYKENKYTYEVVNIYTEDKNGYIDIQKDPNQKTLTLTTCKPNTKDKQLVVIANQIKEEKIEKDSNESP